MSERDNINALRHKERRRTKKGVVETIYNSQKQTSKRKGYSLPTYNKKELEGWIFSQPLFHVLYDNWKRLDYQKNYKPSIDRKDDYVGYTMDNIQLMTWEENKVKGEKDRVSGINNKINKTVIQYSLDGEYIAEHHSISEAGRYTNSNFKHISSCCRKKRKTHNGFIWRYTDEKI